MKKFLVIGNPIQHSLSPLIHNYWIKKSNIDAIYEKEKLEVGDLKNLISKLKKKIIHGINVTVPFKKDIIFYLEKLSPEAERTQSVNTIYLENNIVTGHNTDIDGFGLAIQDIRFDVSNKHILIVGAGGVVPSIIYSLIKMKAYKVYLTNRNREKAENLKKLFKDLILINWGEIQNYDMIINATSVGLNASERLNLDFSKIKNNKLFYDVIYNPKETNFLKNAKILGNKTENGKKMFIYQAALAFKIWHGVKPEINEKVEKLLD
jgi:shikimate dehydrogenase|tara:strand:- start:610 stop:1401 length:792 start_codon:yes stop_codon:yes gene_type:complete